MLLYVSNATDYSIYNRLFQAGIVQGGYQAQKFNHNIISGLSQYEQVTAISTLPYTSVAAPKIDEMYDGIRYIAVENTAGTLHKPMNLFRLFWEGARLVRQVRTTCILCDAYSLSPNYASRMIAAIFRIPIVGIVTDLPGLLDGKSKPSNKDLSRMQHFDGYILLTHAMNALVNPQNKPYMIMEGIGAAELPEYKSAQERHRVILYTGALWKKNAGIECLVEGFLQAKLDNYELHFYGTGELVPWLEEIGRDNPSVKYMGCLTNEEIVCRQCESALLVNPRPSNQEFCKYSFPSKTIEYMASGTPMLTTKLPGIPQEYFNYCFTVEEETPNGFAVALDKALREGRDGKIGVRAREFIKAEKSCSRQAKRIVSFLNECILTRNL